MPDYDLTRLGCRAFEQLIVSLARVELGPAMRVFGDGPDGGREATFDGTIDWAATVHGPAQALGEPAVAQSATDVWSGHTVVQAKYRLNPSRPHENALWLQQAIKGEIERWVEAARNHSRSRLPDYLVFVTNVDLSAVARTGGIDTVESLVAHLLRDEGAVKAGLRVHDFKIWHADQVRSMIDAHQQVRWAFDGLLTAGDVLAALAAARLAPSGSLVEESLREDLLKGLAADRWVRLRQAGAAGDAKLYVDEVAIDLPVTVALPSRKTSKPSPPLRAVQHVLDRGDAVLRAREPQGAGPAGIVLVGGPGQGKSTLSQLIAQAYRASLLDDADLAPEARQAVDATRDALARLGVSLPSNRRWPVRLDLAKLAEELHLGVETSLLAWMSKVISRRTTEPVTPSHLKSWLRVCPWALVLDGLDEVPSLASRRAVYDVIGDFFVDADDVGADVLMVVTTRPVGYDERLSEDSFEHLLLQPLPAQESAELAERLTARRFEGDEEMRELVASLMRDAAANPTTARLMSTPLQVTVMSVIVEKFPTLPPDRYTLFDLYYETIFDREVAKGISTSRFLNDHRQRVNRLHELVGLELQIRSESSEGAEAVLPTEELRSMAESYLSDAGYEGSAVREMAEEMVRAATHRLVLIVPLEDGVGFEIRTLQELMAARAVAEGADEAVFSRLTTIADSAHWRNTWLLAAGRLLMSSDRFEKRLIEVLAALDIRPVGLGMVSPRASIAADLISDGLGQQRPAFERALVSALLSARDRAPLGELGGIASALNQLMDGRHRDLVTSSLRAASSPLQRASAAALLDEVDQALGSSESGRSRTVALVRTALALSDDETAARLSFSALTSVLAAPAAKTQPDVAEHVHYGLRAGGRDALVREALIDSLRNVEIEGDTFEKAVAALSVLEGATYAVQGSTVILRSVDRTDPMRVLKGVDDQDCAVMLQLALDALPSGYWPLSALLANAVHLALTRRRPGVELTTVTGPTRA